MHSVPMSLLCLAWKKQSSLCAVLNVSLGCLWRHSHQLAVNQKLTDFHFRWKRSSHFLGEYLLFFQISFSELKDSKETIIFMEKNKNRKFPIFNVHGNLKQFLLILTPSHLIRAIGHTHKIHLLLKFSISAGEIGFPRRFPI